MAIDTESLYGEWQALTGVLAGQAMPEQLIAATKLTLRANEYLVDLAGAIDQGVCKIQFGDHPIKLTIEGVEGPNAGKTFHAILEFLTPDEIRIAYDLSGTGYPESFEPTSIASNYVATLKRC